MRADGWMTVVVGSAWERAFAPVVGAQMLLAVTEWRQAIDLDMASCWFLVSNGIRGARVCVRLYGYERVGLSREDLIVALAARMAVARRDACADAALYLNP